MGMGMWKNGFLYVREGKWEFLGWRFKERGR